MERENYWYGEIKEYINIIKLNNSEDDIKEYKIDNFLVICSEIEKLSESCDICQEYQIVISHMIREIKNVVNISEYDKDKYLNNLEALTTHVQKYHGLNIESEQKTVSILIGLVIGGMLGVIILDRVGLIIGPILGIFIGSAIGSKINRSL